jgi:steroid 5-alpha reductase family enzyme
MRNTAPLKKTASLLICAAGYVIALIAAILVVRILHGHDIITLMAAADVTATVVIFIFSMLSNNSSFYDPYWSVAPIPIVIYLAFLAPVLSLRMALIMMLFFVWGTRLTWNWARRWKGFRDEDWRYADFRKTAGPLYWVVSFLGFHFFPTVIVFLGCLPVFSIFLDSSIGFNAMDIVALLITAVAILIESEADRQLWEYKKQNRKKGQLLQTGLWAWSRHPNYFGEVLFWWGLWTFTLAAHVSYPWLLAGPVAVSLLFIFISVPMADKRMLLHKPLFERRIRTVSALVPMPPKKA